MKRLEADVYQPGEQVGTMSKDGKVAIFTVDDNGGLRRGLGPFVDLNDPLEEWHIGVRTYNCLKREGVDTIGQMIDLWDEKGPEGLLEIRNFGEKCVTEVRALVTQLRGAP